MVESRRGLARYVGYAVVALAALWNLGLVTHAAHMPLAHGRPDRGLDPQTRATPFEARLGRVATVIAGRPVGVRCDDLSGLRDDIEPGGVVEFVDDAPANYARIRYDICTDLLRVARGGGVGGLAQAEAVAVLAHESFHLRGIEDEATAECYAVQFVAPAARALGASPDDARRLAAVAIQAYGRHPPEYLSSECRPGGALELDGRLAFAASY